MSIFIMLVGIPGSGKSTAAAKLAQEYEAVILSSDTIREEMFNDVSHQADNELVFTELHRRMNALLSEGKNVIHDATNISRKRRKHLINHVVRADRNYVYHINEAISTVKERNRLRDRRVNEHVIEKMYKNLQVPILNEGWDKVTILVSAQKHFNLQHKLQLETILASDLSHDDLFLQLSAFIPEFSEIYNLPHDSSYHSFSVSRHTYHVYLFLKEKTPEADLILMLWAALFHDLGKAFCKSFVNYKGEQTKYANFIGHEHVSSQLAFLHLADYGYEHDFITDVSTLVQFHMIVMNASEKKHKEVEQLIGPRLYKLLMLLQEADMQAI